MIDYNRTWSKLIFLDDIINITYLLLHHYRGKNNNTTVANNDTLPPKFSKLLHVSLTKNLLSKETKIWMSIKMVPPMRSR